MTVYESSCDNLLLLTLWDMQELEKGLEGMLEQYRGIEQEEDEQPAAQPNGRTSKRNRQATKGRHCCSDLLCCLSALKHRKSVRYCSQFIQL